MPKQEVVQKERCGKCGATRQDRQLGLEATPEEYVANMVAVFREVRRVLRDDGTLWLNLGDSYAASTSGNGGYSERSTLSGFTSPDTKGRRANETGVRHRIKPGVKPKDLVGIPWRVAFALQADGWYLRSDIIWAKPNPMPESVTDRPTKAHEYLFLLAKSPRYWYDAEAVREAWADEREGWSGDVRDRDTMRRRHDGTMRQDGGLTQKPTVSGRNRRSVWTIATQPYPGAHFAVMPEALVEPCILAGCPDQTCSECGAPWERIVERTPAVVKAPRSEYGHGAGRNDGGRSQLVGASSSTTGWRPTCDHGAPAVPGTVLDPFGGSGTVARVANRLSRRAVLIDLNPEYLAQQLERNRDMPLGLTA